MATIRRGKQAPSYCFVSGVLVLFLVESCGYVKGFRLGFMFGAPKNQKNKERDNGKLTVNNMICTQE